VLLALRSPIHSAIRRPNLSFVKCAVKADSFCKLCRLLHQLTTRKPEKESNDPKTEELENAKGPSLKLTLPCSLAKHAVAILQAVQALAKNFESRGDRNRQRPGT
jgi:hypothetical protein